MKRFTLIELLIVVAIIGIILSMLLPSLNRARERARISVCMSNQAQTFRGLTEFATKNDHNLPTSKKRYGEWLNLRGKTEAVSLGQLVVGEYIDPKILYCPSWTHPVAKYNVKSTDGKYGGWADDKDDYPTQLIWSSIAYRHYPENGSSRSINLMKDENTLAVTSDHWTKRANIDFGWDMGNGQFGHYQGINYVTAYLNGAVKITTDKSRALITLSILHGSHDAIENGWREYFDLE